MWYKSLSFFQVGDDPLLDVDLVRLGAFIGFNDVTIQTSGTRGGVVEKFQRLREAFDRYGYAEILRESGMTLSAWLTELNTCGPDEFGPFGAGNDRLFDALRDRYRLALGEIFPEVDNIVLKVTESKFWVAQDEKFLTRLVETIHEVCTGLGKKLFLNTFAWHPQQVEGIVETIRRISPDIFVQIKCVPQDWAPGNIHNPLLGAFPDRHQIVEVDIFGENAGMHYVANCRLTELKRQFDFWSSKGVEGIQVRVARFAGASCADPDPSRTRYDTVLGAAQEANLWFLGAAASGGSDHPEEALRDFTASRFGKELQEEMAVILRYTGEVVQEAQSVGPFLFGRQHPLKGITRGYPAVPGPQGSFLVTPEGEKLTVAEANELHGGNFMNRLRVAERYEDGDDMINRNPFHLNWAAFRWDPSYLPLYQKTRKGDPEIIRKKEKSYAEALRLANASIEGLMRLKGRLDDAAFAFYKWKLEENRYYLIVRSELAIAWLKAERRLYTGSETERRYLIPEIEDHLSRIEEYHEMHGHEQYEGTWMGRERRFLRGSYFDTPGLLAEFRRFWRIRHEKKECEIQK